MLTSGTRNSMSRAAKRSVLLLLAFIFVLCPFFACFSMPAAAAEASDFAERFLCTEYKTQRGSAALSDDKKSMRLNFYGVGSYLEGTVASSALGESVNALRFTVLSCTRSAQMTVSYSYTEHGEFVSDNSISLQLERSEDVKVYTVSLPDASKVKRIRFTCEQASLTSLTLSSLLAVSAYADSTVYAGKIDSCILNGSTVSLKGTIPTATVAARRGDTLALYVLEHGNDTVSAEPAKTAPISAKFEIKIPFTEDDISGVKYFVCLLDADGGSVPVAPAVYATKHGASNAEPLPYKGVLSDGCTDIGEGTALADVDLSRLCDMQGGGYAYRFEGEYFYFDRKETDRLKAKVARNDATGCETLLRILCSNPAKEVPFTYSYNESGVFYYSLNATTPEGRKYIRAAVSFLSEGLGGSGYRIYGFIVGKNIDKSGEYNFMGADYPLDKYAENYLHALRTVYAAAKEKNPAARVFAGLSGEWESKSVGRKYLFPDYDAFLLLEALAARAAAEGGVTFSVLTESGEKPISYTDGPAVFGGNNAFDFLAELEDKFGSVSAIPVFLWTPMGGSSCTAFSYLYYSALFKGAEAFILDLNTAAKVTDRDRLISVASCIDTVKTLVETAPYLSDAGINAAEIEGYAPEKLVLRDIREGTLSIAAAAQPLGSVIFRDYTKRSATPDLVRCESCEVYGYGEDFALCEFSASVTNDCAAVIDLNGTDELSLADVLFFDVKLDYDGIRTVTFSVCGNGVERQYSAALSRGSYRLYTDGPIPLGEGEHIKLSLSGEGKLYLYRVGGESTTKFSALLSAQLNEARGTDRPIDSNAESYWGIFLCVLTAISAATAVMMRRSSTHMKETEENESSGS
ncbi:MAG: hypothetical protein IJF74_00285 [Clostridia bacterium]|nr:hypothetical protein [Clostridia bacterium]